MLKLVLIRHGHAREPPVLLDDGVIGRVDLAPQQLRSRRPVDVHRGRAVGAHPRRAVEGHGHELGRVLGARQVLVAAARGLEQRDRREGHELGAPQPLVEPLVHGRLARMVEDRAVAQRARPVLHAAVEARDDLPRVDAARDLAGQRARVGRPLEGQAGLAQRGLALPLVPGRAQVDVVQRARRGAARPAAQQRQSRPAAAVAHVRVDEGRAHAGQRVQPLVQLTFAATPPLSTR
jgi:hypothetical protein